MWLLFFPTADIALDLSLSKLALEMRKVCMFAGAHVEHVSSKGSKHVIVQIKRKFSLTTLLGHRVVASSIFSSGNSRQADRRHVLNCVVLLL